MNEKGFIDKDARGYLKPHIPKDGHIYLLPKVKGNQKA